MKVLLINNKLVYAKKRTIVTIEFGKIKLITVWIYT